MKYKHFYIAIAIRLVIIILVVIAGTYLLLERQAYWTTALLGVLVLFATIDLVRYFNKINEWISFFLLGIENEDNSLRIPAATGNKSIDDVFRGMNKLNELFKQVKIDNKTQEQHFKTVINQSATGLFSVNEKGRVMHINPAATKLVNLEAWHHINSLGRIDEALPNFIRQNDSSQTIFENQYGQKLLFRLSQLHTQKEEITLVAVSDITKELDNREVEAWVKLARTLSHEIMNNITPITTLSQVISGYFTNKNGTKRLSDLDAKTIDNAVKGLNVIEERSLGLMNFVNNYRKFTKLPEPQIEDTNVSDIVEKCLIAIRSYPLFDVITLEKSIPPDVHFPTDAQLLSQVITNLLKNAYEALIGDKENIDPRLKVKLTKEGYNIKIEIINNGAGIPPELREQIFVPFFTTKEDGTGIGLSLSKQILLQMNGDIILKPTANSLTRFIVVLNRK